MFRTLIASLLLASFLISSAVAQRRSRFEQSSPGDLDYYILALSWAPNFCATHTGNANECGIGRHRTFVVHGLWPQGEQGRLNQPCQHTSPVAQDVVQYALNFYPAAGLVQHEWQCHGIYSGLSSRDYFTAVGRAFQSLRIPPSISSLASDSQRDSSELVRAFEKSNSTPRGSFVTSCHDGELVAIEACFTRDLKLRSCGYSLHSCSGPLLLRAPR